MHNLNTKQWIGLERTTANAKDWRECCADGHDLTYAASTESELTYTHGWSILCSSVSRKDALWRGLGSFGILRLLFLSGFLRIALGRPRSDFIISHVACVFVCLYAVTRNG